MKKVIAILLLCTLFLTACSPAGTEKNDNNNISTQRSTGNDEFDDGINIDVDVEQFKDLSDADLLAYVEDEIYAGLEAQLDGDKYQVESVDAIYISQEYIDELEFNSKENIFFGYSLSELDQQYEGTRYVFTLGEDGQTTTKAYEKYDDTYDKVIKNVAIGSGVIIVCTTVSVVSGGLGAPPAVSMIFAASAKTGAQFALSTGAMSGFSAAIITGFETKDFDEALKAGALAGSEGFKYGAISGVLNGGMDKSFDLNDSANSHPTPRESELIVLERTKGGNDQISFKDGVEVKQNTTGATRPDITVNNKNGTVKAIEVKNYNLESSSCRSNLYSTLEKQVTSRVKNLPSGSTQEIVLDTRGRGFSKELTNEVIANIQKRLEPIYPDIPINILAY